MGVATGKETGTLSHGGHRVQSVAFSGTGKLLAFTCHDGTVRLWEVATWKQKHEWSAPGGFAGSVKFGPDDKALAGACSPAAYATQPFEVDHIVPHTKGGLTVPDNLALSCGCNSYKGQQTHALDPVTGRRFPLFHPRRQRWSRHFAWSDDFTVVFGRTATGRTTVQALHLNRPELVKFRRLLRLAGEHPPTEE